MLQYRAQETVQKKVPEEVGWRSRTRPETYKTLLGLLNPTVVRCSITMTTAVRATNSHGRQKFWPRQLVRKWLSMRHNGNQNFDRDFHMDVDHKFVENDFLGFGVEPAVDINELHEGIDFNAIAEAPPSNLSLLRGQSETLRQQFVDQNEVRVAVHTWNVAGKPPPPDLNLNDWVDTSTPADIYVFGFQEIVPLNANNVLCVENGGPAVKWEAKIRETLNDTIGQQIEADPFQSRSAPASPTRDGLSAVSVTVSEVEKLLERCVSGKNLETAFLATEGNLLNYEKNLPISVEDIPEDGGTDGHATTENGGVPWPFGKRVSDVTAEDLRKVAVAEEFLSETANIVAPLLSSSKMASHPLPPIGNRYSKVASKQMVGLFITVWVRSNLWRHVHNVKVSAVGCGLMHYLGNKGSISVSMSLHHTNFCFVCSHLTAGHIKGDELRRNADVAEILRRTKFPRNIKVFGIELPETILAHDRIVWLGDLNYRLSLPDQETWKLVKSNDWAALLRVDQLKLEQDEGRVFRNWKEGEICFPPTYKFKEGTDQYAGETTSSGEKRRSPAWCDRILWYGNGLKQSEYVRGDLKLSDHRSVSAVFMAEVEVVSHRKLKKACVYPKDIEVNPKEILDANAQEFKPTLRKSHRIRKLGRSSSFVYPESSVSSAEMKLLQVGHR